MIKEETNYPGLCSYRGIWEEAKNRYHIYDPKYEDRNMIRYISLYAEKNPPNKPFVTRGTRTKGGEGNKWLYPIDVGNEIIASLHEYFLNKSSDPERVLMEKLPASIKRDVLFSQKKESMEDYIRKSIIGYLAGRLGHAPFDEITDEEYVFSNTTDYSGTFEGLHYHIFEAYGLESTPELEKEYKEAFDKIWKRIIRDDSSSYGIKYYLNPEYPLEETVDIEKFIERDYKIELRPDYDPTGASYDLIEEHYTQAHNIYNRAISRITTSALFDSLGFEFHEDRFIKDIFRAINPEESEYSRQICRDRLRDARNYYSIKPSRTLSSGNFSTPIPDNATPDDNEECLSNLKEKLHALESSIDEYEQRIEKTASSDSLVENDTVDTLHDLVVQNIDIVLKLEKLIKQHT